MTLKEVKLANPHFFTDQYSKLFLDEHMTVEREGDKHVLKVASSVGTRPVYLIDPATKHLSYLRHDCTGKVHAAPTN